MLSRTALPADELVGEPRLLSLLEEQQLIQGPSFTVLWEAVASDAKSGTRTRKKVKLDDWKPGLAHDLSQDHEAMKIIHKWLLFCTALRLPDEEAALLFVETIATRYTGQENEALQILLRAQVKAHKGLREISLRDVMTVLDEIKANIEKPITDLKWATSRCTEWNQILRSYFALDSEILDCKELLDDAITVLREMRQVTIGKNKKLTKEFRDKVKSSGLSDTLGELTNPYVFREVDYPYIQLSEGLYHWRVSFGAVLESWTPKECREPDTPGPYGSGNSKEEYTGQNVKGKLRVPLATFLAIASDERFVRQATASAENSFFPSSEFNFLFNWVRWIAPTIRGMRLGHNIEVKGWTSQMADPAIWNIWALWRDICDISAEAWAEYDIENPLLRQLLQGAALERAHLKQVKEELLGDYSTGGRQNTHAPDIRQACMNCVGNSDLRPDEYCTVFYQQARRSKHELDQLEGAKLTFAEHGDVLKRDTNDNLPVFSPAQLGYLKIASRPEVQDRCGRDVHVIIGDNEVQGIVSYGTWRTPTLNRLRQHHTQASYIAAEKKRSEDKQLSGSIQMSGSRMPMGGRPGGGYGVYAHHDAQSVEGMEALQGTAEDCDILQETVRALAPGIYREIRETNRAACVNHLGRTGMNTFTCSEYCSQQHRDNDRGWSLCCQLFKNCREDEYNFAYAEWGVYIVTEINAFWIFRPQQLHGTVLPRQSSVDNGAISRGTHTTLRERDAMVAKRLHDVRVSYESRMKYWRA